MDAQRQGQPTPPSGGDSELRFNQDGWGTTSQGGQPFDLGSLWSELVSGRSRIVESTLTADRALFTLSARDDQEPGASLPVRHILILESTLLLSTQKAVAADVGLSLSSIATIAKSCFRFMGLSCAPCRAPLLLVMIAHAAHSASEQRPWDARVTTLANGLRSVSVSRPDTELASLLSPAKYAVTRSLLDGKTYAQIAAERGTCVRTIANQLAAVFQQLRVSGRAELLRWLVTKREADAVVLPSAELVALANPGQERTPATSPRPARGNLRAHVVSQWAS
ncbi:MAG TPA: hypothetical protein VER33_13750 [Polyangiaceae bacterium]|nr:hypothetical protein [Polyangiaceae bacterium]